MSGEARVASSPTPHRSILSSEAARHLARLSWANTTPQERSQRTLPARLAAAQRALGQLDAQTRGAS
jgi:hypothetical protein